MAVNRSLVFDGFSRILRLPFSSKSLIRKFTVLKGAVARAHPRDAGQQFVELLGLSSTNLLEKVMHKNPVASPLQMFYGWKVLEKIGKEG